MRKKHNFKYYNKLINQIEKIRKKNNKNWMDLVRISFKHNPREAKLILKNIFAVFPLLFNSSEIVQ